MRVVRWSTLLTVCVLLSACSPRVNEGERTAALQTLLSTAPSWVESSPIGKRIWTIERTFYQKRGHRVAWIDREQPTAQMNQLLGALQNAHKHGLSPQTYLLGALTQLDESGQITLDAVRDAPRVAEADAQLTYAYLRYAADLLAWGAAPRQVYVNWLMEPKQEDLAARVSEAIASDNVGDSLEALAPTHPQYKGLQAALEREEAASTGRAEQLKMNLERWRWMPRDLGDRYILINVPAYQMQVVEGEKPALAMRVIVGKPDTPTPLFSDEMTYVVFSPYWNIPESIMRQEALPRALKDPEYLTRNHIEVIGTNGKDVIDPSRVDWSDEAATKGLHFRQAPGPENALGLVKFIFPNHFNIYLHDTPGDALFNGTARALSHGCIRVEDPAGLARYVLRDQPEWTESRITEAMHGREEQAVTLARKIPVYIGYWTAWVEPGGSVAYTADPYRIDDAHARQRAGHPNPVRGTPTGV